MTLTYPVFRIDAFEARKNVSLETDRLLRAAALLSIYLKEREMSENRARKEPLRVIDAVRKDLFWMKERADLLKDIEPADVLWDVIPKQTSQPSTEDVQILESVWDVFISHASETKSRFSEISRKHFVQTVFRDIATVKCVGFPVLRPNGLRPMR